MNDKPEGMFKILMMVYVPEATNGMGMLNIQLPNRKEYEKVKKQIAKRKDVILFTNEYGEPMTVYNRPPVLSLTLEKTEPKIVKTADGQEKPLIHIPNTQNVSNIRN